MKIISTSKVQKNIKILSDRENIYTFINNGEAKTMLVPYYEGLQKIIENYLEDMEMYSNRDKIIKEWKKSLTSGLSNLTINENNFEVVEDENIVNMFNKINWTNSNSITFW